MNNKQFIEDCKRRTPTARINTGTGKMLDEALARITDLEGELGRWKQIVIYDCEDDTDIRELAKPFTDTEGDSYGVPTPPDIVEQLCKQLTTANATLDKLRETAASGLPMAAKNDHAEAVSLATYIIDTIDNAAKKKED